MNKDNRWTRFASEVSFKDMTPNNKAVLEYVASKHHSDGATLSFREIGDFVGITKQSAKNNIKKLEEFGILRSSRAYGMFDSKLSLSFKINLSWKEKEYDTHL